jgi:hypothetical protein
VDNTLLALDINPGVFLLPMSVVLRVEPAPVKPWHFYHATIITTKAIPYLLFLFALINFKYYPDKTLARLPPMSKRETGCGPDRRSG